MRPALSLPFNDPDGTMFHHLQAILPDLKEHFERAYICPSLATRQNVDHMRQLQDDEFFLMFTVDRDLDVGERFAYLYQRTAETAPADQIIHLCFLDRLAFALESDYRDVFLADIDSLTLQDMPLVFQRSQTAWETHPQNYRLLEGLVTTVAYNLFGRVLDYCWCHFAATAGQLREIVPLVRNPGISMVAEILYYVQDEVKTRDVDWLAWEDPLLLVREPTELRNERENSLEEINKRLNYVVPMLETLTRFSSNGRK
jgi:hypothetical protein